MWLAVIPAPRQGIDTLTAKGET